MFHFKSAVIWGLLVLTACGKYEPNDFDPEAAMQCVRNGISIIQSNSAEAEDYVDMRYIADEIAENLDISRFQVFSRRAAVERAFRELSERFADATATEVEIVSIRPSNVGGIYDLQGRLGQWSIVITASFAEVRQCKIRDVRVDGYSIVALLVGRVATMPEFTDTIDVYADIF